MIPIEREGVYEGVEELESAREIPGIVDIEITAKEVADFFRSVPINEREFTFVKAVEVGVLCLERARTAQDTDFVKRRISELLTQVECAVTGIPKRAEEALLQKIGSDDGQVLHPIKSVIDQASSETTRRINELKVLFNRFAIC